MAKTNIAGVADSRNWLCDSLNGRLDADGLLFEQSVVPPSRITDGLSNTLMVGEVTGGGAGSYQGEFWASYAVYDTSGGINGPGTVPGNSTFDLRRGGFSSYHTLGCNFAMADGSARFINKQIQQVVLAALTTRAGAEAVTVDNQ